VIVTIWFGAVVVSALLSHRLFVVGASHVLSKERLDQLGLRLVVPVAIASAAMTFLFGLFGLYLVSPG
jgi:hypothetical protein